MFVSKNQIYVFIACVAFGGIAGVVFSVASILKLPFKNKILLALPDFLSFVFLSFLYLGFSTSLRFPTIRLFMPIGVLVGIYLYFKSFNIILAKWFKKIYNISVKKFVKVFYDRRKSKKTDSCRHRGGGGASSGTSDGNDLSVNINKR